MTKRMDERAEILHDSSKFKLRVRYLDLSRIEALGVLSRFSLGFVLWLGRIG